MVMALDTIYMLVTWIYIDATLISALNFYFTPLCTCYCHFNVGVSHNLSNPEFFVLPHLLAYSHTPQLLHP